jgi:ABC-2 type transport system permease protein
MKRFLAVLHARNLEFIRDRASLAWNLIFPVMLVLGFAMIFANGERNQFKVGVVGEADHAFLSARYIQFIPFTKLQPAVTKVERHQLDLLISSKESRYWVNTTSPNGYIVEQMLKGSDGPKLERAEVSGREVRYVDWLVPGVLGMNMMFSALFGIGFVIVRYRKNGVLKRLQGTPLSAAEFLSAQIISRLLLIVSVSVVVYIGCDLILDFAMFGSYWALLLVLVLGALSLISMGLLVAARLTSDELAGGLANFLSWPMMLLSGVWFSLDGSPAWVLSTAQFLPLTHVVDAARAIMLDGAGLADISIQLTILALMSVIFLIIGVVSFKWD